MNGLITIPFDLNGDVEVQVAAFRKLKPLLEAEGVSFSSPARVTSNGGNREAGPNELAWLKHSKRTRMNLKDKGLSREEQAIKYLQEAGLTSYITPIEENESEEVPDISLSSGEEQDGNRDPFS